MILLTLDETNIEAIIINNNSITFIALLRFRSFLSIRRYIYAAPFLFPPWQAKKNYSLFDMSEEDIFLSPCAEINAASAVTINISRGKIT